MTLAEGIKHFIVVHAKEKEELAGAQLSDILQQFKANTEKCHALKAQFYNISDEHPHKWEVSFLNVYRILTPRWQYPYLLLDNMTFRSV